MRYRIQAPAMAKIGGREITAFTRDISASAVHFRISAQERAFFPGESLGLLIWIPPTMSSSTGRFIKALARTIRIENAAGDEKSVVAEFLEYEIQSQPA